MKPVYLVLGAVFGWLLHQAGATDYQIIAGMFRGTNFYLAGVMATAIGVAAAGFRVLGLVGRTGELKPKPMQPRQFLSGLIFGVGWAITGACPGTALAQLGEGRLYALFTVAGILCGTWLFGWRHSRTH